MAADLPICKDYCEANFEYVWESGRTHARTHVTGGRARFTKTQTEATLVSTQQRVYIGYQLKSNPDSREGGVTGERPQAPFLIIPCYV